MAYALDGRYSAVLLENPEERLAIADEIIALSEVAADQLSARSRAASTGSPRSWSWVTSRPPSFSEFASRLAEDLRQAPQRWCLLSARAVLAMLGGRFADAQALMSRALARGERAQSSDAVLSHKLQLFLLRREVGGLADVEPVLLAAVSEYPARATFRCALADLYAEVGRLGEARAVVDELAHDDFAVLVKDNDWLFLLSLLADVVDALPDVPRAAVLYDLLLPFAHLNAATADELATGSMQRPLGVLAAVLAVPPTRPTTWSGRSSTTRRWAHARGLRTRGMPTGECSWPAGTSKPAGRFCARRRRIRAARDGALGEPGRSPLRAVHRAGEDRGERVDERADVVGGCGGPGRAAGRRSARSST